MPVVCIVRAAEALQAKEKKEFEQAKQVRERQDKHKQPPARAYGPVLLL